MSVTVLQVVVKCPSAGVEQTFLCDKWLALDEGEGLLEYTLFEQMSLRKQQEKSQFLLNHFIR